MGGDCWVWLNLSVSPLLYLVDEQTPDFFKDAKYSSSAYGSR